ncbi:MAG: hypothetical protein AB8B56_12310 [Crocinitomicaceae bacterium]
MIFVLFSCSGEYSVEDELYACIEQEFSSHSLNLEAELDSLEVQFLDEGLIESTAPADYRNYYQENINQGILRSLKNPYAKEKFGEIDLTFEKLERCALRKFDSTTYSNSKFGQISNLIDEAVHSTGQIASSTVANAHLKILSSDDFEHPFYRANILLSLQIVYYRKYVGSDEEHLRPIPKKIF